MNKVNKVNNKMNCTENLLRRRAVESTHGWTKSNVNGKGGRVIALGNNVNCNGEVMENKKIKGDLLNFLEKYKVYNFQINRIETVYTRGYELIIDEEEYNTLVEVLKATKVF